MFDTNSLWAITKSGTPKFSCLGRVFRAVRVNTRPDQGRADANRLTIRTRSTLARLLLGVLLAASGCSGTDTAGDPEEQTIEEALRLFGDSAPSGTETPVAEVSPGFAILLARVPPNLANTPELARDRVAEAFGREGEHVHLLRSNADRPALIVYGRYAEPGEDRAQSDLASIRAKEVEGRTPFARAIMVPTGETAAATTPPARHDLRGAKKLLGPGAVYTLQIGVYAREDKRRPSASDREAFQKAAEQAVERLRREGEQAFFYHGPNGSMVTVGVFDDTDLDTSVTPPLESARLKAMRERHPNNLLNGRGVREMIRGEDGELAPRMQESRLVLIPE